MITITAPSTRQPTQIRTADLLALITDAPTRVRDVAHALGVGTRRIPGHMTWLVKAGLIRHTRVRGYYVRTEQGEAWLTQWRARENA